MFAWSKHNFLAQKWKSVHKYSLVQEINSKASLLLPSIKLELGGEIHIIEEVFLILLDAACIG